MRLTTKRGTDLTELLGQQRGWVSSGAVTGERSRGGDSAELTWRLGTHAGLRQSNEPRWKNPINL